MSMFGRYVLEASVGGGGANVEFVSHVNAAILNLKLRLKSPHMHLQASGKTASNMGSLMGPCQASAYHQLHKVDIPVTNSQSINQSLAILNQPRMCPPPPSNPFTHSWYIPIAVIHSEVLP